MGKQKSWGTLDEVIDVCKKIKNCICKQTEKALKTYYLSYERLVKAFNATRIQDKEVDIKKTKKECSV